MYIFLSLYLKWTEKICLVDRAHFLHLVFLKVIKQIWGVGVSHLLTFLNGHHPWSIIQIKVITLWRKGKQSRISYSKFWSPCQPNSSGITGHLPSPFTRMMPEWLLWLLTETAVHLSESLLGKDLGRGDREATVSYVKCQLWGICPKGFQWPLC